jgi:hypothetical protein
MALVRSEEASYGITQYNKYIDLPIKIINNLSLECLFERPLTTLLPDFFKVSKVHLYLYLPSQNHTLSTNIFVLSLIKESPQFVTLNQTKFFKSSDKTFFDLYFKVSFWDRHLSSHLQCHFNQVVEGAYTRYTKEESVIFTSPIVKEDIDSDLLRCRVPINKEGPLKVALMDISNGELVSSANDLEVFEQIEIKTE